jgi:phage-related protein
MPLSTISVGRKPLHFTGSSLSDLKAFPEEARRDAGFNLDFVQRGFEPEDWKPMRTAGVGVKEIRVRDSSRASRDLSGFACRGGICAALFSEEIGENESARL